MPPHSVYIESHLGGGALMKRKPTGVRSTSNAQALDPDYPVELWLCPCLFGLVPVSGPGLVYSDPPYLHATRRSARRYRFDYEEVDHVALLDLLKDLPCQVMVSGHPSALYDEMLAGWRSLALQVTTQAQVRTEVVWFNFAPDRVHWASYAGRNFTDRQRIKRKAANWGRRYKALPAGERLAVLAAMMAVDADAARWHEDLAAHDEAFACLQDLLDPSSFATTVVKAFREWGQGLLRLATALVRENAALERENATLRDRIAELERSAALDSTTSSKPPASDGLRKKSGTQRRTRSQRGKSGRPSGGQPGHKGTTLARTESPDHVVDHDPSACSGCGAPLSDADRHRAPVCRQVFDVPEPRPLEVTEHRAHRWRRLRHRDRSRLPGRRDVQYAASPG